jgi:hypothetical protein
VNLLRPILLALAGLAALGLIVRQVNQAVKRTFSPPAGLAQRDPSTPQTQNGLTLLGFQNVSPDHSYNYAAQGPQSRGGSPSAAPEADTGLWVKMPPAFSLPSNHEDSTFIGSSGVLSATARTSDGLQIPLRWRTTDQRNTNDPVILLLDIPAGYPDTVRWADVTLDDHQGGHATWRITHLPPMQHVLAAPVAAQAAFHQGTITAHAAAYQGPDPNGNLKGQVLLCDVTGTVKPSPHQWELGPMTLTREWEVPGYVAPSGNVSYGTETKNGVTRIGAADQVIYAQQVQPYLADTHWVRLTGRLQEFETYDETVVFHNLSVVKTPTGNRFLIGAQSEAVTMPSGITATLVDPRPDRDAHNHTAADAAALMIQCSAPNLDSLPHSPLWQRFKGVVTLSCEVPKPYESYGSIGGGAQGTYMFRSAEPLPKLIASFPVIVRQRVNLRAVPMTFTLPVGDKPPKAAR